MSVDPNTLQRKRPVCLLLIFLTIAVGLFSRSRFIPLWIYPYLGDVLYTVMYYFIFGFIFPKKSGWQIALWSILTCYLIEFLQFYQAPWINEIRSNRLGGLILGFGFLWSDLIAYTVGGLLAFGLEKKLGARWFYRQPDATN